MPAATRSFTRRCCARTRSAPRPIATARTSYARCRPQRWSPSSTSSCAPTATARSRPGSRLLVASAAISCSPEATITGTAVANAAIWIDPDRDDSSRTSERAARQISIADADGRFRITDASGGRYRIGGAARGTIAINRLATVEAGGTIDVTVHMVPAETLHDARNAKRVVAAGTADVVLELVRPNMRLECRRRSAAQACEPYHLGRPDRAHRVGPAGPCSRGHADRGHARISCARADPPLVVGFAHFDSKERRQNADHSPVSDLCRTSTWKTGEVLVDRFSTTLPSAETFTLKIGFFRPGEGPWQNLARAGDLDGFELGKVTAASP